MVAISLIEASNCSIIFDEEVTEEAWDTIDDHSESEGVCFGGDTPSLSEASEIVREDAIAMGISSLCESKSASVMKSPAHSIQRDSDVVQYDLASKVAETSMSSLLSMSLEESATPILASNNVALWKRSSESSRGQFGSDRAAMESISASGNLSERILTSGRVRPRCIFDSLSATPDGDVAPSQTISSTMLPWSSTTRDRRQSKRIFMAPPIGTMA